MHSSRDKGGSGGYGSYGRRRRKPGEHLFERQLQLTARDAGCVVDLAADRFTLIDRLPQTLPSLANGLTVLATQRPSGCCRTSLTPKGRIFRRIARLRFSSRAKQDCRSGACTYINRRRAAK